ncbi:MAG: rRNA maturation RNase YbeY [Thermodesulfobacteriota bacterium]|nr:rRNA maturation RNase YbeY [Thermodesulfobacteriota bacterium]
MRTILRDLECPDNYEISILFVNDKQIEEINREYLGRSGSTNVISFSMGEGEFSHINPQVLGDVIISVETAERHACESQYSFEEMIDFLLIHGILHLLGYEHEGPNAKKEIMEEKEEDLMSKVTKAVYH